jgi:hypothetical protein
MPEFIGLLCDLFLIFLAAKIAAETFERVHQPPVIGELLAGVLIGPYALGWIGTADEGLVSVFNSDTEAAQETMRMVYFRAREFDREQSERKLVPLQARLGRLLRRGQENPDRKAAALCRALDRWWAALWTSARVDGVEPTNTVTSIQL